MLKEKAMKSEIRIIGGTKTFEQFLKKCLPESSILTRYETMKDAVENESVECQAYLIMPDYDSGETRVPELDFETLKKYSALKKAGQSLFIENYDDGDYVHSAVFGHIIDSELRYFFSEYVLAVGELADKLPCGNILQARGSYYFPGRSMGYHTDFGNKVLLEATDCIGTNEVYREGSFKFPLIVQVGSFLSSAMNMTQFDRLKMLPVSRWKRLFSIIFANVLGVDEDDVARAFDESWQAVGLIGSEDFSKDEALKRAVDKAVDWHKKSGLMLSLDGKSGIYEMIRSNDLKVRANIRTDSNLITGLLFCIAGKYNGDKKLIETGESLIRFLLDSGIQIEDGEFAGFFKWFLDIDEGPLTIWSSDSSRAGLVMINMYQLTRLSEYLERAEKLGNAILKWLGPLGLLNGSFCRNRGYRDYQGEEHVTDNPVYYGEMASFLLQLYKATNNDKYKDAVLKFTGKIMDKFPDIKPFGYSDNFTYSRYLVMISVMQEILKMDLSVKINGVLEYFKKLQHECGGLRETPIIIRDAAAEAGVGIGDGSDNIADMLYCNNFILAALSVISRMKNPYSVNTELAGRIYKDLTKFILGIQIDDADERLDGAWMRAFDMDSREYHGLNKDKDWGAYCIMAGWTTGFIPLALLSELGEQSPFI
jgi:hypothetical protein